MFLQLTDSISHLNIGSLHHLKPRNCLPTGLAVLSNKSITINCHNAFKNTNILICIKKEADNGFRSPSKNFQSLIQNHVILSNSIDI